MSMRRVSQSLCRLYQRSVCVTVVSSCGKRSEIPTIIKQVGSYVSWPAKKKVSGTVA
jgi:hypothetical protein